MDTQWDPVTHRHACTHGNGRSYSDFHIGLFLFACLFGSCEHLVAINVSLCALPPVSVSSHTPYPPAAVNVSLCPLPLVNVPTLTLPTCSGFLALEWCIPLKNNKTKLTLVDSWTMSFLPSSQRKLHKLSRDPFFSLIPRNFKLNFLLVFSSSAANLGGGVSSVFLISSMAYDLLLLS